MTPRTLATARMLAVLAAFPVAAVAQLQESCDRSATAAAIEAQRDAFNRAIRDADLAAIEAVLAEDVVLVTGTWSDLFPDRAAQLAIWSGEFDTAAERWTYERTPDCIRVSGITPMAMEDGQWRGNGPEGASAAGSYTAKWRRVDGEWRLEAELFMTETCTGTACPTSNGEAGE